MPWTFSLPNIFGYSTFTICMLYYNAWPNPRNGTNYWCLWICIGPPKWRMMFDVKIDFWNKKDLGGWRIIVHKDGGHTSTHIGGPGEIIYES